MLGLAAVELLQPRRQSLARGFGLIQCAQRLSLGIGGAGQFAFRRDQIPLNVHQLFGGPIKRMIGMRCSVLQGRQALVEFGKPVLRFQPCGLRRTFAAHHQTVPAAQLPRHRHKRMTRLQRPAIVVLCDMHQGQQSAQFRGAALDMGGQTVLHGRGRFGPRPVPPLRIAVRHAQQRLAIAAQRRGDGPLVSLGGPHAVDRLLATAALGHRPLARLPVALQRFPLALHAGQFGPGFGEVRRCLVPLGLQFRLASLHALQLCAKARNQ